ncbi:VOC family protein [Natronococcus sp. A-GB1]|uniref:VOC family protein n=1 Tax=Natronococcus sp. A-GB1 TaxID=3037648 RepID=UPI00241DBA46|nr:VOC family protein [Natronococcus sp. A-GB1]MDG5760815.1 VOC family protein [Natronococcus sp. A-GB1]
MTELSAHHVGVTVDDLEETLPFYRDVLGLEVLDRFSVEGKAFADAVGVDGAGADFVHLDANGVRLELVEYDSEANPRSTPELDEPGATHVGLAVADLEGFYADLPEDVPTISEPRTTASGTSICFLRDPEGNLVEVLET